MSGLFGGSKPKVVEAPTVPPTPPVAVPEASEEVETIARRRRPRGRRGTFLTGDLIPSEQNLKSKLG